MVKKSVEVLLVPPSPTTPPRWLSKLYTGGVGGACAAPFCSVTVAPHEFPWVVRSKILPYGNPWTDFSKVAQPLYSTTNEVCRHETSMSAHVLENSARDDRFNSNANLQAILFRYSAKTALFRSLCCCCCCGVFGFEAPSRGCGISRETHRQHGSQHPPPLLPRHHSPSNHCPLSCVLMSVPVKTMIYPSHSRNACPEYRSSTTAVSTRFLALRAALNLSDSDVKFKATP